VTGRRENFDGELRIRDADAADASELSAFAATLFRDAYTATTRSADLESYIAEHFRAEIQAAEIAAAECRTLLLELEGQLAGYAQMRRGRAPSCLVQAADAAIEAVEIRRFYVAPRWRGRGVARGLMAACLDAAPPGCRVWLGVFTHNARAIAFYTKCGFRVVGNTTFLMGDDPQRDHVMQWTGAGASDWVGPGSHRAVAGDTGR
jgi:diamine N-acetyltransferase